MLNSRCTWERIRSRQGSENGARGYGERQRRWPVLISPLEFKPSDWPNDKNWKKDYNADTGILKMTLDMSAYGEEFNIGEESCRPKSFCRWDAGRGKCCAQATAQSATTLSATGRSRRRNARRGMSRFSSPIAEIFRSSADAVFRTVHCYKSGREGRRARLEKGNPHAR